MTRVSSQPTLDRTTRTLIVGTRGSALARWQTEFVMAALQRHTPELKLELSVIKTAGDKDQVRPLAEFGGLGVFTQELEHALLSGEVDIAVHSLKDLPTEMLASLNIAAILEREDARDAIVSRHGVGLMQLPRGARIGTSSARRAAQVLALRPDVTIAPLRGNVDTRLRKAQSEDYDAIVIAAAGLIRLGRPQEITEYLDFDLMLPDPGQGALAVQIRVNDEQLDKLVSQLDHAPTRAAVTAERAFLQTLGGGCRMPMGAYAEPGAAGLRVRGMVGSLDGAHIVSGELSGETQQAEQLGTQLARQLLDKGAAQLLNHDSCSGAPLRGKRIVVTRASSQAGELSQKIRAQGGEPIEFPVIDFAPLTDYHTLDNALTRVNENDWVVFTSANGVRAVAERLKVLELGVATFAQVKLAAIGPGTARVLAELGIRVDFIPSEFLGEQVGRELPILPTQRALLLRADIASDVLADILQARGVQVVDVDTYHTGMPVASKLDLTHVDAVTFTSSSTVRNFMAMLDDAGREMLASRDIFCIGPVTAETAHEFGLNISAVASEHTLDGLIALMCKFYSRNQDSCAKEQRSRNLVS